MRNLDLTICSVVFDDRWHLDLNWDLCRRLNPGVQARWLVVENKPKQPHDAIVLPVAPTYDVVEGVDPSDDPQEAARRSSFHHGRGLNVAGRHVKTRYALYLDPDCYMLRPNWLVDVLQHMQRRNLAFFGIPYAPQWFRKPRYFPSAVCLVIDTHQVPLTTVDFQPVTGDVPYTLGERLIRRAMVTLGNRDRWDIGRARDTGFLFTQRYRHNRQFRWESVQPVFKGVEDLPDVKTRPWIERLMPDTYSFVPRRRGYTTRRDFQSFGLYDYRALGAEEFVWRDAPFAVHLRVKRNVVDNPHEQVQRLINAGCPS